MCKEGEVSPERAVSGIGIQTTGLLLCAAAIVAYPATANHAPRDRTLTVMVYGPAPDSPLLVSYCKISLSINKYPAVSIFVKMPDVALDSVMLPVAPDVILPVPPSVVPAS